MAADIEEFIAEQKAKISQERQVLENGKVCIYSFFRNLNAIDRINENLQRKKLVVMNLIKCKLSAFLLIY